MEEDLIQIFCMLDFPAELPCRINRHKGIVSVNRHAEFQCNVCNQCADCPEADDPERFAEQLRPCEGAFSFFHQKRDLFPLVCYGAHIINGAEHIAAGHNEFHHFLFLDGLRIGTGAVEHNNPRLCALLDRDIVVTRPRSRNGKQLRIKLHIMQVRAADQHGIRPINFRADFAALPDKCFDSPLGDGIHGFDFKHVRFQTPS